MKLRAWLILPLIILVFILLNLYIGWHGSLLFSYLAGSVPAVFYWILFWITAFSYLIGRLRFVPGPLGRLLKVTGAYYYAVFEFAIILLPIADLSVWILGQWSNEAASYVPMIGLIVITILMIVMLRGSWNAWNPIIRNYSIEIDKKAGDIRELRIAVASDIHLGLVVGKRHLRRLVKQVEALRPDLILLPGDVIDDTIEPFVRNQMSKVLQELQARFGTYAILGNHEYYGGHIEEYVQQMSAIDIAVLRDETTLVNNAFYIVGRKDRTAESIERHGRLSIAALLADLDLNKPVFVMDHQPYQFDKAAEAGADLLLSGHTHRGQIWPNHWITGRIFELDWGYLLKNKMHVIVSSGFGTWGPPIRLASRSEIIDIHIRFQ